MGWCWRRSGVYTLRATDFQLHRQLRRVPDGQLWTMAALYSHPCATLRKFSHRGSQECGPSWTSQFSPTSWWYGRRLRAVRHNHLRPFLAGRGNKMRRTSLSSHYPSRLSHQASFRHGTIGLQVSLISHTQVFRWINTDPSRWHWVVGTEVFSMGMDVYELGHMTPPLFKC